MRRVGPFCLLLAAISFQLSAFGFQHAAHVVPSIPQELLERPVTLRPNIGVAHDEVATTSTEAKSYYLQGLAYLHNYVWLEAARSFHQALRLDANLAIAHAGLSLAYVELNKPAQAKQAIERAIALAPKAGDLDHDRRHIDARALQMAAEDAPRDAAKLAAYRKALDAAIAAFPADAEFLLLRGIAESPDPADRGQGSVASSLPYYERALKARSSVESVKSVDHFAAHHYMAHAFENGGRMKEAESHASAYAGQASAIPHAVHMHGHELRRQGRVTEAIRRFEAADKLQRDYFTREKVAAEFDWHHQHNLDLLAASYQYVGQMRKAEALLKQSFGLPTNLLVQAVNKREWPAFLLARGRAADALAAAKTLMSHPHPVVQATGNIEAGFALLAANQPADGGAAFNTALRAMRAAPAGQALAAIELEALQGEFMLRTAQREKGRQVMESAAKKWRSLPGPDAWSQALFRLEALGRAARAVGDWPLAARMAQLMLEHDANYAGTHLALALVAHHDDNLPTARREAELAAKAWAGADKDLGELKTISDLRR